MPSILPIILASTHLVLAADRVPQFNIEPTCHAVAQASPGLKRDDDGCKRDESAAHDKLNQEWDQIHRGAAGALRAAVDPRRLPELRRTADLS